MNKLFKKYLISTYSQTFFPIFLTLYTITSIIFLVKIASLTSIIQINILELLELYSYSIPTILFYTLPITIFVSFCLSLIKLSSEYELIVITSFGLNPIKILKLIFPTLFLTTILLLLISLALIPKAEYMKEVFVADKKVDAQFNIKASEYGQEFGKWLIYVEKENKGVYANIVLFSQDNGKDIFIIAKKATMNKNTSTLNLNLKDGKVISITDKINQIDFKEMDINNEIKVSQYINSFSDLILYWKDMQNDKLYPSRNKEGKFTYNILTALFPITSILLIVSLGYYNPRYEKNNKTFYVILTAILYLVLSHKLANAIGINVLYYVSIIWILFSIILYRYKIKPNY